MKDPKKDLKQQKIKDEEAIEATLTDTLCHNKGVEVSQWARWNCVEICKVFVAALTDSNMHTLRRQLVPIINKHLGCNIAISE